MSENALLKPPANQNMSSVSSKSLLNSSPNEQSGNRNAIKEAFMKKVAAKKKEG